jgi:hypothetical protein
VPEPSAREFRYKITSFVEGVLTLDARVLRYRQSARKVQVPYANIRRFGLKRRPRTLLGVVTSELVLRTEPAPGQVKLVQVAFDPDAAAGKEALVALRALVPGADTSTLPWPEAAAQLGVPVHSWRDTVVSRWGVIGTALVVGTAGVAAMQALTGGAVDPATRRLRAIVQLAAMVTGLLLLGIGHVRSRGKRD